LASFVSAQAASPQKRAILQDRCDDARVEIQRQRRCADTNAKAARDSISAVHNRVDAVRFRTSGAIDATTPVLGFKGNKHCAGTTAKAGRDSGSAVHD
jgi:hypothetical protein